MFDIREKGGAVFFPVKVRPRSSKSAVTGAGDGSLNVCLKAPPVDGAANLECVRLLAKTLGVSRNAVTVVSGRRSRRKTLRAEGFTAAGLAEKMAPYINP